VANLGEILKIFVETLFIKIRNLTKEIENKNEFSCTFLPPCCGRDTQQSDGKLYLKCIILTSKSILVIEQFFKFNCLFWHWTCLTCKRLSQKICLSHLLFLIA